MSALFTLVRKELAETTREKRLPAFALLYSLVGGLVLFFLLRDAATGGSATPPSALGIALPLLFLDMLALVLVAATFVLDAVGKERDANMLGMILTTPASPATVLGAKLVTAALAYVVAAALGLAFAAITSLALGAVVLQAVALAFAGPLLALYAFLVGAGLLLSVLARSARFAIALGVGLYFPLFLMGATPLFAQLFAAAPVVGTFLSWTPFSAALQGVNAILTGGATPWTRYAASAGAGLACLVLAFVLFQRQEVARS